MTLFVLLFFASCNNSSEIKSQINKKDSFINYLKNTSWVITNEKIIGFDSKSDIYELIPKTDSIQFNFYGINFTNNVNFESYDSWECGNDCFTTTYGHYDFIETDKIKIYTDSISRNGTCEQPTIHLTNKKFQVFTILKNKNKVTLTKSE